MDNIVSQRSDVNLKEYKKLENMWASEIKNGKKVKVKVEIKYDGDSLRPSVFDIEYTINGEYFPVRILN